MPGTGQCGHGCGLVKILAYVIVNSEQHMANYEFMAILLLLVLATIAMTMWGPAMEDPGQETKEEYAYTCTDCASAGSISMAHCQACSNCTWEIGADGVGRCVPNYYSIYPYSSWWGWPYYGWSYPYYSSYYYPTYGYGSYLGSGFRRRGFPARRFRRFSRIGGRRTGGRGMGGRRTGGRGSGGRGGRR